MENDQLWTHVWIGRRWLPERYGQRLRIRVARKGKFWIEFEDGTQVATVRGTFRRVLKPAPSNKTADSA